jgi:hypothetical protein
MSANTRQIAGGHYVKYGKFQVWDAWWHWRLDAFQANIIKYVMRTKGGVDKRLEDLDKAEHYLQKYEELLNDQQALQDEQFNEATWDDLSDIQRQIVRDVAYGDIRAKLETLAHVKELIAIHRETLTKGQE